MQRATEPRPSRLVLVGIVLAGISGAAAIGILIAKAWAKVAAGQGLETYRTAWLVEFNHVGFLVFIVALAVALVVGGLFRLRERRQWRELEQKYGQRDGDG